ncbi:MAG: TorF family putative porin [Sphingopyxis sp.]|nr:TorF family putative porin [Sphingopyxis sp.]
MTRTPAGIVAKAMPLALAAAILPASPLVAQGADPGEAATAPPTGPDLSLTADIASDHRRRGLSWSDGRAAASARAQLALGDVELAAVIVSTRGSARHGGGHVAIDLSAGITRDVGGISLSGWVTGHIFPGRANTAYGELSLEAAKSLGPAQFALSASYAPAQSSIGGDNLYLSARGNIGIPGTRWTLAGHVGRSTGSIDDATIANRLRPGGRYDDWGISADYVIGKVTLGARYTGTDIDSDAALPPLADRANVDDRIALYAAVSF